MAERGGRGDKGRVLGCTSLTPFLSVLAISMAASVLSAMSLLRSFIFATLRLSVQWDTLPSTVLVDYPNHSLNISSCPGYTLIELKETRSGITARLNLAGDACNAFGQDIADLTLQVTYDTQTRLRVNIFDTAQSQFAIPASVIDVAGPDGAVHKDTSDLVFNYEHSPFAFWVTRRSKSDAQPLFDTRASSLPPTPIPPVIANDGSTALDGFPLVFEDQYIQLTSALPFDANVYGLGEVMASGGFRRDVGANGGVGTIQTMWARGAADPIDENMYGSHPIYLEHRYNATTHYSQSHGVFHFSAAGSDILLLTPPSSPVSLVQYRLIGGTLDFCFFSGPSPQEVVEQYGTLIGLPTWQPAWGFGFHLCRWGYHDINETREQVENMRAAGIPLEVIWNDIDMYHAFRDFTTDPVTFPAGEVQDFIHNLTANHQHYIPIVDAGLAKQVNETDIYDPYTRGVELDTWIKNPDGSEYVGQVWPRYTVFPDWFANNTLQYWTEALRNWSAAGVEFSGLWLDKNEISSACNGSCGAAGSLIHTARSSILPGGSDNLVAKHTEVYHATLLGRNGNISRELGEAAANGVILNDPPYALHNGNGPLWASTLATNATHAGGFIELDVHNMWGMMEEKATHLALQALDPTRRPFIISRSTFPSSGRWTGHWLGDNFSKWQYMHFDIQGVLQFQLFQIPFVGADTCGFNDNTDEELCNRWMQLSAFMPFYRNHNKRGALSQEPYRWDSVANALRTAIGIRYSLLPYWYTLFANASMHGTPPVRALFFEFPNEPELFSVDTQYLVGRDILVTPVLTPNVSSVDGIFPGRGLISWRDWYTHELVDATPSTPTTLRAPLGHINIHIRDGSALLLHARPAYTINETQSGPYSLLVSQAADGYAFGNAYIDDGETTPPTPNRTLTVHSQRGAVRVQSQGNYKITPKLTAVTGSSASETGSGGDKG